MACDILNNAVSWFTFEILGPWYKIISPLPRYAANYLQNWQKSICEYEYYCFSI